MTTAYDSHRVCIIGLRPGWPQEPAGSHLDLRRQPAETAVPLAVVLERGDHSPALLGRA